MIKSFENFINESLETYNERYVLLFDTICDVMEITPAGKEFKELYVTSRNDDSADRMSPAFVISVEPIDSINIILTNEGGKTEDTLVSIDINVKLIPDDGELPIVMDIRCENDVYGEEDIDNIENFDELLQVFNYKK